MSDKHAAQQSCDYKNGTLPSCAPLAVSLVPEQASSQPQYEPDKALASGTLFPGLDLPFRNITNKDTPDDPLAELMAIDFACTDLALYLDTHKDDKEAFAVYKDLLKLSDEGRRRYARLYGPICRSDLAEAEKYTWLKSPWPWDFSAGKEA